MIQSLWESLFSAFFYGIVGIIFLGLVGLVGLTALVVITSFLQ